MFQSEDAKQLATTLRRYGRILFGELSQAFAVATVGTQLERDFLDKLAPALKQAFDDLDNLIPEARFSCRTEVVHSRPKGTMASGKSCELGDLLVAVKYRLLDHTFETKSILYQVKLADGDTQQCRIDQVQLGLLKDWPPVSFGKRGDGGPRTYVVKPNTTEFGSYMLEPRGAPEARLTWELDIPLSLGPASGLWDRTYGLCPTAFQCFQEGPKSVSLKKLPHVFPYVDSMISHLIFATGEHHINSSVAQFVAAIYRYLRVAPDPPEEFPGERVESKEDGFALIEVSVDEQSPDDAEQRQEMCVKHQHQRNYRVPNKGIERDKE
ncbi:MAG: hypothetical protein AB1512_22115 [Thermodesulfobacteriota bacterium]